MKAIPWLKVGLAVCVQFPERAGSDAWKGGWHFGIVVRFDSDYLVNREAAVTVQPAFIRNERLLTSGDDTGYGAVSPFSLPREAVMLTRLSSTSARAIVPTPGEKIVTVPVRRICPAEHGRFLKMVAGRVM